MRRVVTAIFAVTALLVVAAVPVGAQVSELPRLGFGIEPHQGPVGSQVDGLVDVGGVEEYCVTSVEEFVAQFVDVSNPDPFATPYMDAMGEYVLETYGSDVISQPPWDAPTFATAVLAALPLGFVLDPANADAAFPQTFVMAFADIATSRRSTLWVVSIRSAGLVR